MRTEYLNMRNKNNFDIHWLYNYFTDKGGNAIDINTFMGAVQMYGIEKITKGLDKVFEITTLSYTTGEIIKYY